MLGERTRAGFTLTELLVVIACIALLAAILLPAASRMRENARDSKASSEMAQISSAIEQFKTDHGNYPRSTTKWVDLDGNNPPGQFGGVQNNNMRLAFLLTGAECGQGTDTVYWNQALRNENFIGNGGSYLPRAMTTAATEALKQWKTRFPNIVMESVFPPRELTGYNAPNDATSYMLLDPWGQPYLYFWQRDMYYKCNPSCFVSMSGASHWDCPHEQRNGSSIRHEANGFGRPVDAPQPAKGFEYAYELWSAGRDLLVTRELRSNNADKDNLAGVPYK